jgi:hypothetical protein
MTESIVRGAQLHCLADYNISGEEPNTIYDVFVATPGVIRQCLGNVLEV